MINVGCQGDDRVPIIVNESYIIWDFFGEWFGLHLQWSSPWYFIIDQNFIYHSIHTRLNQKQKNIIRRVMLTNME